jgi:hypothetical protein
MKLNIFSVHIFTTTRGNIKTLLFYRKDSSGEIKTVKLFRDIGRKSTSRLMRTLPPKPTELKKDSLLYIIWRQNHD